MATGPLSIDRIERWVLFGAQYRIVEISSGHAVVDFCTCTGALVERLQSDDPAVIDYLRTARSELDRR